MTYFVSVFITILMHRASEGENLQSVFWSGNLKGRDVFEDEDASLKYEDSIKMDLKETEWKYFD
jgi:hypothetical protein